MNETVFNRISDALSGATKFVLNHRLHGGSYRLQGEAHPTTLSTAIGAIAHYFLTGTPDDLALDRLSATRNEEGLFTDPLLTPKTIDSVLHPYSYLVDQTNYFSVRAFRICSRQVMPAPLVNSPVGQAVRWIEALDWTDPWLESNRVMFAIELLEPGNRRVRAELLTAPSDPVTWLFLTEGQKDASSTSATYGLQ